MIHYCRFFPIVFELNMKYIAYTIDDTLLVLYVIVPIPF